MRYRSLLLLLVALGGTACGNHEAKVAPVGAAPPTPAYPYELELTFAGLVGYYQDPPTAAPPIGVWALLPRAHQGTPPSGVSVPSPFYPTHYAVLEVDGRNVKGIGLPGEIQIPIDGYEIKLPANMFGGSGLGLTGQEQKFVPDPDPKYAASDKLDTAVLDPPSPSLTNLLAARMHLPLTDLAAKQGTYPFENVHPQLSGKVCPEPVLVNPTDPRVETVVWNPKNLSSDLVLTLQPLDGSASTDLTLVPVQGPGPSKIQVSILNQMPEALYDPSVMLTHWSAYRWFYNLSDSGIRIDCRKHYYPLGPAGGNRCPQKLYN